MKIRVNGYLVVLLIGSATQLNSYSVINQHRNCVPLGNPAATECHYFVEKKEQLERIVWIEYSDWVDCTGCSRILAAEYSPCCRVSRACRREDSGICCSWLDSSDYQLVVSATLSAGQPVSVSLPPASHSALPRGHTRPSTVVALRSPPVHFLNLLGSRELAELGCAIPLQSKIKNGFAESYESWVWAYRRHHFLKINTLDTVLLVMELAS